jgi:hypothetical protein
MKLLIRLKTHIIAGTFAAFAASSLAQTPGSSPGLDAVMLKLYGENKAFTASTQISISDTNGHQILSMPVTTIQLNGTVRSETDMEKIVSANFPPGAIDQLKGMGMTKVISIVRPDSKDILLIYPGLSSYVVTAMPKEQSDAFKKEIKLDQTELGKETVEGHPCVKTQITATDSTGTIQNATVWKASDMKGFPVKIIVKMQTGEEFTIAYNNVKLEKPEAALFNPPTGYTKYTTQQELIQKAASVAAKP